MRKLTWFILALSVLLACWDLYQPSVPPVRVPDVKDYRRPNDVALPQTEKKENERKVAVKDVLVTPTDEDVFISGSMLSNYDSVYTKLNALVDIGGCIAEERVSGKTKFVFNNLSTNPKNKTLFDFVIPIPNGTTIKCFTFTILDETNTVFANEIVHIQASKYLYRLYRFVHDFAEEARLLFVGYQGVGKSSIINSLIHLLSGRSVQAEYARVESVSIGDGTTFGITDFGTQYFIDHGLQNQIGSFSDAHLVLIDSLGRRADKPYVFTAKFWERLFKGEYPQGWIPEENNNPSPDSHINKHAHLVIFCVSAQTIHETQGIISDLGDKLETASVNTGGKLVLAITMPNKVIGRYNITNEEVEKLVAQGKKICPNVYVFQSYETSRESDWDIDYFNLKTLIRLAQVLQTPSGDTEGIVPQIEHKMASIIRSIFDNPGHTSQILNLFVALGRILGYPI